MSQSKFSPASRARLTPRDLERFPGSTLFDRIGRAVCGAGCLPRKELYEAWEMARRVRRLFRGGRGVDLGGGHRLLAPRMSVLGETAPEELHLQQQQPAASGRTHAALVRARPRHRARLPVSFTAL